jgi:hypothetical protein
MPVHAVTALFGEHGLRARFATEIARIDDTAGQEKDRPGERSSKPWSSPGGTRE